MKTIDDADLPIRLEHSGAIALLTLNRPDKLNAVSTMLVDQLSAALDACESDDDVAAVLISGSGRSFCAGVDLTEIAESRMGRAAYVHWEETLWRIETFPKPVICAMHGYAIGAGIQLALACDLRIATPTTILALPAAKEGLIPGMSTHRLWRFVGMGMARRMALFNEHLDGPQAVAAGLADRLAETGSREGLIEYATHLTTTLLADIQPMSFVMCKRTFALPRYTPADSLEIYLTNQDQCLNHEGHVSAAREWLARTH